MRPLRIQKVSESHNERLVVGLDVTIPAVISMLFFYFDHSFLSLSLSLIPHGLLASKPLVFFFLIKKHRVIKATRPSLCRW